MSELSDQFGALGKALESYTDQTADKIINQKLEPLLVLNKYENVDVLTFDETCEVLRLSEAELKNAIAADLVPFVRLGKSVWQFPKVQLVEFLLGNWRKSEPKKPLEIASKSKNKIDDFVNV